MIDPKTFEHVYLDEFSESGYLDHKLGSAIFDTVYIKYFIKEELEEILKIHRGRLWNYC